MHRPVVTSSAPVMGCASSASDRYEVNSEGKAEGSHADRTGHSVAAAPAVPKSPVNRQASLPAGTSNNNDAINTPAIATDDAIPDASPPISPNEEPTASTLPSLTPKAGPLMGERHPLLLDYLSKRNAAGFEPNETDLRIMDPLLLGNAMSDWYPVDRTNSVWHEAITRGSIHLLQAMRDFWHTHWPALQAVVAESVRSRGDGAGGPENVPTDASSFVRRMLSQLSLKVRPFLG